jgi:CelD/BcsL family acetyltransferase involved in cellulose biosynthesis
MANIEKPYLSSLRVELIRDLDGWKRLESEWNVLLRESVMDAVFLCWEWLDTWLEVYGDGGEWVILTARDQEGQLLGVAPMMFDRGAGPVGRWMRRLILLGQKADTASEYLDWVLLRGHEEAVANAFCQYLFGGVGRSWDLLRFDTMRADSPTLPLLEKFVAAKGRTLTVSHVTAAPYLSLPESWDAFMASRSGTFRTRWNKFHREHCVAVREAGVDLSVVDGMQIIRELNERRWGDRRQSFLSDRYRRFHDTVSARLHNAGYLAMLFLEADGQIVAGRYDFSYAGKAWCFQGGWLPEWEKERAGKMMLTAMMRWCIEHGLGEYDFLGGEASYKNEWGNNERCIVDIQAANPRSLRGKLFDALKRSFKAGRPALRDAPTVEV